MQCVMLFDYSMQPDIYLQWTVLLMLVLRVLYRRTTVFPVCGLPGK